LVVGFVHVGLYITNYKNAVTQEDIPLDQALNALLELITTCTAGSATIGKGQWMFSVSEENHVGKREHARDVEIASRSTTSQELPASQHGSPVKRLDSPVQTVGVLAAWPVLRLGLEDETQFFGTNIVAFNDAAENPLIDAVAQQAKDQVHQNAGNSNEVSVNDGNSIYAVRLNVCGIL
jgi:hypothetical protein